MFEAQWTEVGDNENIVVASGTTEQEALVNLEAKLRELTFAKFGETEEPPLELSGDRIVCDGFVVGQMVRT